MRGARCGGVVGAGRGAGSEPEVIEFPTDGGRTAYGLYYPPANAEFFGVPGEAPPLLVKIHGGPTSGSCCGSTVVGLW